MIEPRKEDEMGPVAAEVAGLGNRVSVLEVKVDGLSTKVDERFEQVDRELLEQRREMKAGFDKLNDRLAYALMAVIGAGATIATAVLAAPHL